MILSDKPFKRIIELKVGILQFQQRVNQLFQRKKEINYLVSHQDQVLLFPIFGLQAPQQTHPLLLLDPTNSSQQFQLDQATVGKEQIQKLIRRIKLNQYPWLHLWLKFAKQVTGGDNRNTSYYPYISQQKIFRWFKITLQLLSYYLAASEELKYIISLKMAFDQNSFSGV
ncbi:Hypothetical_protein [Hexamita inflata]|uniref:Hypothetical_protein n=1 Tax=Hexamita inflata TaxID=28002 RepID=A0AA86NNM4_9EUKA|nr:Hypothetical protein HINF_LOCUS10026 [Hexamita inflata]